MAPGPELRAAFGRMLPGCMCQASIVASNHSLLPTPYSPLATPHFLLPTSYSLLTTSYSLLPLCQATIIASPGERSIIGGISTITAEWQHRYASGDTLSGRRRHRRSQQRRLSVSTKDDMGFGSSHGGEKDDGGSNNNYHSGEGDDSLGRVSIFCVAVGAEPARCSEREGGAL